LMETLREEEEKLAELSRGNKCLTVAQSNRMENLNQKVESLESSIASSHTSVIQSLGLVGDGPIAVSKQMRDIFDTSLFDEEDEFFDRTKQQKQDDDHAEKSKIENEKTHSYSRA